MAHFAFRLRPQFGAHRLCDGGVDDSFAILYDHRSMGRRRIGDLVGTSGSCSGARLEAEAMEDAGRDA
jgi:hypothetical protein